MSNSLQDQLLKSGLVDAKKAKAIKKDKNKKKKQQPKGHAPSVSEEQLAATKAIEEKREKDRALNMARQAEAEEKALVAQVAQLVQHYQIKDAQGDIAFNFNDKGVVKRLHVTQRISDELARGRLCIVYTKEQYKIVPRPIADKIKERHEASVILYQQPDAAAEVEYEAGSDEEYYAQFEIPDDLVW